VRELIDGVTGKSTVETEIMKAPRGLPFSQFTRK
jgi:hypothetical protein